MYDLDLYCLWLGVILFWSLTIRTVEILNNYRTVCKEMQTIFVLKIPRKIFFLGHLKNSSRKGFCNTLMWIIFTNNNNQFVTLILHYNLLIDAISSIAAFVHSYIIIKGNPLLILVFGEFLTAAKLSCKSMQKTPCDQSKLMRMWMAIWVNKLNGREGTPNIQSIKLRPLSV